MRKLIAFLVIVIMALLILNLAWDDGPKADRVFEMANRHIEWTYAGK